MGKRPKSQTRVEDETSYLASIADLMSGLLFIFIITLMVFALTYAEQRKIAEDEKRLYTDAQRAKEDLLQQIEERLRTEGVTEIVINKEQGVLHLGERILFEKAKADLNQEGIATVKTLAVAMSDVLPCFTRPRPTGCTDVSQFGVVDAIFIEGHTDKDQYKGTAFIDNYDLSTTRAHNVYYALKHERRELDNLMNLRAERVLSISGYGQDRPLYTGDTEADKRKNRRIDIRFVLHPVANQEPEPMRRVNEKLQNER